MTNHNRTVSGSTPLSTNRKFSSFKFFLALVRGITIIYTYSKTNVLKLVGTPLIIKKQFHNFRRFGKQTFISCIIRKLVYTDIHIIRFYAC